MINIAEGYAFGDFRNEGQRPVISAIRIHPALDPARRASVATDIEGNRPCPFSLIGWKIHLRFGQASIAQPPGAISLRRMRNDHGEAFIKPGRNLACAEPSTQFYVRSLVSNERCIDVVWRNNDPGGPNGKTRTFRYF